MNDQESPWPFYLRQNLSLRIRISRITAEQLSLQILSGENGAELTQYKELFEIREEIDNGRKIDNIAARKKKPNKFIERGKVVRLGIRD